MNNPKDLIDLMIKGLEEEIKPIIKDELIKNIKEQFEEELENLVSDRLAEILFSADKYKDINSPYRDDIQVLIKWTKLDKEKRLEYKIEKEVVEK